LHFQFYQVMAYIPYTYQRVRPRRYVFFSEGKHRIKKVVDFSPLGIGNILNLGFGDLQPDGSVDDKANSNNGDIIRVLATVVDILKDYTAQYPNAVIYFKGSTAERTKVYGRILRSYYEIFSKDFMIMGMVGTKNESTTVPFDPQIDFDFLAFLVKRIS
jgi:hypothetical protein